ncbi:MBL fold metallo-hydrolase [Haliscomenobacter sp.]|uniref:MBL fold metallo-hydrolase n=1 Tax=Haliscomenobacter sp. TaxID=2717303 RepID=UPI003BA9F452
MLIFLFILALFIGLVVLYLQLPQFGKAPSGERLQRIKQSPHYKETAFANEEATGTFSEGHTFGGVLYSFLFEKKPDQMPKERVPSTFTDLHQLPADVDALVWFGHSSYFLQVGGIKFLIDPVFSGNASPISGSNQAFKGSDIYAVKDMPALDYLLITHDHYDHLDYPTVKALQDKVQMVICGLGVGSHLERWGYPADRIIEKDWYESLTLGKGMTLHTLPTRHFSGRTFRRNNTLWLSFLLESPNGKFYLGGDSGYGEHFAKIGDQFGPIDLAILENGQYNPAWHEIHCFPEETLKAAKALKAKRLMPVHSSKFALAMHPWYEPLTEITRLDSGYDVPLVTPMIGECVNLQESGQVFQEWWKTLR